MVSRLIVVAGDAVVVAAGEEAVVANSVAIAEADAGILVEEEGVAGEVEGRIGLWTIMWVREGMGVPVGCSTRRLHMLSWLRWFGVVFVSFEHN